MVTIENISKTFHQKRQSLKALDGVSLEIEEGDIVGIIGASGAGKSTLIRCVNLLEKPDEGRVVVKGKDLMRLNGKELAAERKKIGMIFQHFNLLSSRTVSGNIALPLELDNVPAARVKARVEELLAIVGLEDKANAYPASLSGGQKQRVAIARALANDPHLLLCDEATSALDPVTTQSILQLLRDINKRLRITILLITHEMDVVKAICNHVAVIDHGKLVTKGTLEQVLTAGQTGLMRQFLSADALAIPQALFSRFQKEYAPGLLPVVELELGGRIAFDELAGILGGELKAPYKVLKADVEYVGHANFGKVLLHLQGEPHQQNAVLQYLDQQNITHQLRGYA